MVASALCAVSPKAMRQRKSCFCVYILKSTKKEWYYIGHTSNISKRINEHNLGKSRSTRPYQPFELIYEEEFKTKGEAFKRELQIKSYKHGTAFKMLIGV